MKYIFLSLLLLLPNTMIGAETSSALEASPVLPNCEKKCGAQEGSSLFSTKVAMVASQLAEADKLANSKVIPARSTSSLSTLKPNGIVKLPNGGELAGFYAGPCTFITAGHQRPDVPGRYVYPAIRASNEFDASGKPIHFQELKRIVLDEEIEKLRGDFAFYRNDSCPGEKSGYFDLDAIKEATEVVLFGLEGTSSKCYTTGVRGREVFHNCPSSPGDSGAAIAGTDSFANPQIGRAGIPVWSALGMHTGLRDSNKVGASAGAILEYGGEIITADIEDSIARKTKLISSTRSSDAP